jgi:hypothetical protein
LPYGASDLTDPLLPLHLTSVLMAEPRVLGVTEGMAVATSSLLKLASRALFTLASSSNLFLLPRARELGCPMPWLVQRPWRPGRIALAGACSW